MQSDLIVSNDLYHATIWRLQGKGLNSLISIKYNSVEGWIFQYEKFKAKLGKDLDTHKLKNLSKTIEYFYAKTKNPSIVDLRSDAGIALKYDK